MLLGGFLIFEFVAVALSAPFPLRNCSRTWPENSADPNSAFPQNMFSVRRWCFELGKNSELGKNHVIYAIWGHEVYLTAAMIVLEHELLTGVR
jgi:hypothetical protein